MRNLAATTELGCAYPAYISVNETDDGQVSIIVRSARVGDREGSQAEIILEPEDPIAERFLLPVLSITRRLVESNLCPELDKETQRMVYESMPAALRRQVVEEIEVML